MSSKKKILLIHGPNLNMLGVREQSVYGSKSLDEINSMLAARAKTLGVGLVARQSNVEGEIVGWIQSALGEFDAVLINPAAYTHTSVAIRDALLAVSLPVVELHMSNVYKREEFRHHSYISPIASGIVVGFGDDSYLLGLEGLVRKLDIT